MYAEVIVEYSIKKLDKIFTYHLNKQDAMLAKVGMKVIVPFGKQVINGIIVRLLEKKPDYETKDIIRIENPDIYLTEEQMALGAYLKEETLCTLITAYQTMLPAALKIKDQKHNYQKYETYIALNVSPAVAQKYIIEHPRRVKQNLILDYLIDNQKALKKMYPSNAINELVKSNLICLEQKPIYRQSVNNVREAKLSLNEEQQMAYDEVVASLNHHEVFLLQGVTGSGKTEVYMQVIEKVLTNQKTALILIPEICLTTQAVDRFYRRFGNDVAIFHSGLSDGEKYDEYQKIFKKEVKIVVGTRSSVFVPLENLGLIIIDEEHSSTYKQENNPRYNAVDVAIFRAQRLNIPVILASATPSLESRARADKKRYHLIKINKRAHHNPLPNIELIDMTKEIKQGNMIFSTQLRECIAQKIALHEQIMLLLNRRGFSTFINCSNCGYTYKCPNCDITLTYHKTSNNLRCHYCGYAIQKDERCPKCHEQSLNYLGLGTQKVEEELHKIFPNISVLRMDQDTTSRKGSYQKIIDAFAKQEYDVLLGTQMISKGLDFANVTLVGVINADTSLNIPDFRANEKTFSLLYQTAGRSGRSLKPGEVLIQTFNPDNKVLNYVKNNDYENFYLYEMNIRHELKYPPYTFIALIIVKSPNYEKVSLEANKIKKILMGKISSSSIILGPTPAAMFKVNNIYHFQITIKYTFDTQLKKVLQDIDQYYINNNEISIDITFNPNHY